MTISLSFTIPLLGGVYVDLVATDAFRGRILQCIQYRGERFIRICFIHAIYTPKGYKHDGLKVRGLPDQAG